MSLTFFSLDQCPATPWKNGGGTTREIACWPPNSTMTDFGWRISVADIDVDGPFSAFPGSDRTIMLLSGQGVQLTAQNGSFDHRLDQPLVPFSFPGEVALDCTLLSGSTQDLNVMTQRGHWHADVGIVRQAHKAASADCGFVLVQQGQWEIALSHTYDQVAHTVTVQAGQGFWWSKQPLHLVMTPACEEAALVMTHISQQQ